MHLGYKYGSNIWTFLLGSHQELGMFVIAVRHLWLLHWASMVIFLSPAHSPCLYSCMSISKQKCLVPIRWPTPGRDGTVLILFPHAYDSHLKHLAHTFITWIMKQEWLTEPSWANTSNQTLKINITKPATTESPRLESPLEKCMSHLDMWKGEASEERTHCCLRLWLLIWRSIQGSGCVV